MKPLNLILYVVYLICLGLCIAAGALNWRQMRSATKIFYFFVITVFAGELTALIVELLTGKNTAVYNVTDIVQAAMILIYFTVYLKKQLTGLILIAVSVAFGIYNYYWIQQDALVNDYFLFWNGFLCMALCLYMIIFLYKKQNQVRLDHFIHFWFSIALLFYWAVNFLSLQMFNSLIETNVDDVFMLNAIQIVSLIISYLVIARVFYRLPQLIQ